MKKKLLSFIFAFCLIIPCIFLLNACGNDKKLNYIQVSLADGEYSTSIYETRDFGNTTGLNNIKIKAYYSDNSNKNVELTNAQITVSFTADGAEESRVTKTFEEYTQMCENSNLTAGFWRLTLKYKDKSCEVNIDVSKVNDNSNYTLKVISKVGNIGENKIYYGTKFEGIDYSVFNGNIQLDDSMVEKKICILNKNDDSYYDISSLTQEEINALPKPNEIVDSGNYHVGELSNELSNLEYIKPGEYLIFAEIKEQENYLKSYSAYQTLVVKKSPIVATAENFKIDFTFDYNLCKGVTLDEMLRGISDGNGNGYTSYGNSKISGKLSLLLSSDLNDENNNLANDNKLTMETLIWHNFKESWDEADSKIVNYGTLAEVNPQTYNFDSTKGEINTITTKVKFVPKGNENYYEKFYVESEEFEITIILHRTAYSAPTLDVLNYINGFKYSTDNNGNPEKMKFQFNVPNYALIPYDATQTELVQNLNTEANIAYYICTNARFEKDGFENYVYSSAVGSYFIRCYINPNLYYKDKYLTTSLHQNIAVTKHDKTSENEGYIEYSWTISKGDIAEQYCYSANGGSIKFNTDNTVELKFGEYDNYKDVHFVWEAQAAGTYKYKDNSEITSNITGQFKSIEGKDLRYQKFVLTTDLTTLGSTEDYYNLYIRIYYSGDDNWDYFEQYLLVQIYKNN